MGALTELAQKFTVVFEIGSEDFGDAEYILAMWYWEKNLMTQMFAEKDYFLGMARRTEPAAPAGKRQEI